MRLTTALMQGTNQKIRFEEEGQLFSCPNASSEAEQREGGRVAQRLKGGGRRITQKKRDVIVAQARAWIRRKSKEMVPKFEVRGGKLQDKERSFLNKKGREGGKGMLGRYQSRNKRKKNQVRRKKSPRGPPQGVKPD